MASKDGIFSRQCRSAVRITVVIPSLNAERFITNAIESALHQVPAPHEVLIQDGGSTDATLRAVQEFGSKVSLRSEPDCGQAQALNRAISRATGDVVVWLNADDELVDGAFAAATSAFRLNAQAEFVYGDFEIIREDGLLLRRFRSSDFQRSRLFKKGCYIFSGSIFFRTGLLHRIGPFDEALQACMDFEYLTRLDGIPWARINGAVARFRVSHSAKSATMKARFVREAYAIRRKMARSSIKQQIEAVLLTGLDALVLGIEPARYSRLWTAVRQKRTL
jgi:glycosyltransferase involved in cell wall biosynthesis